MPLVTFPLLNSENFYEVDAPVSNDFHTKHFLSDWWKDTLYYWQKFNRFGDAKEQFYVLKQLNDVITIQFNFPTTGATFSLKMYDCYGAETSVSPATYMTQTDIAGNVYDEGGTIAPIPLRTIQYKFKPSDIIGTDEGIYYFVLMVDEGVERYFISEPTYIKATHEDTILISYNNSVNDYDVAFSLNPEYSVRLDATLAHPNNKLDIVSFRNQKANLRNVRAINYRNYILTIGASGGTNSIIVDKISNILKCDNTSFDGKRMLLAEGAEVEVNPFSQNYPLSTITIELEEYQNEDSVAWGDAGLIYIMDLGGFPYAIPSFVMADSSGSYSMLDSYVTQVAEAHDTTMEDAIIAKANVDIAAFGKIGSFKKVSGALYYERGVGETLYRSAFKKFDTCLIVTFTAVTTARDVLFGFNQTGECVLSTWDTPDFGTPTIEISPELYIGDDIDSASVPSNGKFTSYFYTDNTCTKLRVEADITDKIITSLSGDCSKSLAEFVFKGATISQLDLSFLFNSATELRTLNWQYTTIDSVDTSGFNVAQPNWWRYFNFIYLLENSLDPTALDDVLNDYQTEILYTYFGLAPVGVIDLRNQTPAATRTSASDLAVTNLTATGYTILP